MALVELWAWQVMLPSLSETEHPNCCFGKVFEREFGEAQSLSSLCESSWMLPLYLVLRISMMLVCFWCPFCRGGSVKRRQHAITCRQDLKVEEFREYCLDLVLLAI